MPSAQRVWLRTASLAILFSFVLTFFLSIFWNPPVRQQVMNERSWFYINRGYPVPFAGVSKPDKVVDFPLIKARFILKEIFGVRYQKVIDLRILLPQLFITFVFSFPVWRILVKAIEENSKLSIFLVAAYSLLGFLCYFFYFHWFPRI